MHVSDMPVHPAAELFPLLDDDGLAEMANDIREHGLVEPVWIYIDDDGPVLLDGRNRVRACAMAGVEVTTRTYTGDDPISFSISQNMMRRHLTNGQKAFVGLGALKLYEERAARRKAHGMTAPGKAKVDDATLGADRPAALPAPRARDLAAKTVGTSGRSMARAKRIDEQAPDLSVKVQREAMPLDRAERIIRDREAEQRRIAQAHAEAAAAPAAAGIDLRRGDFREVLADVTGVDAIITDPPYPAEFLPLLADLAAWADKALAPDGVMAILMGQTHLPDVYRLLDGFRPYRWTCCYLTPGQGYVSHPRKVQSKWKPLVIYGGGPRLDDIFRSEGSDADAKHNHKWGQDYGAFHTIVERLTVRGATVVDPFAGSGTTMLAAHALGRHAIGAEIDEEHYETARRRLLP